MNRKPDFTIYGVYTNSDLTEGRGMQKLQAELNDETKAYEYLMTQVSGVMGTNSGKQLKVKQYFLQPDGHFDTKESLVWGYVPDGDGDWRYGWADGRDLPETDPEWAEYVRLREKFKKTT